MTNKYVVWILFLISITISLLFLIETINTNYDLDFQKKRVDDLDKQIQVLKKHQDDFKSQLASVNKITTAIKKDADTTQELQRLQAQKLFEITKKKK